MSLTLRVHEMSLMFCETSLIVGVVGTCLCVSTLLLIPCAHCFKFLSPAMFTAGVCSKCWCLNPQHNARISSLTPSLSSELSSCSVSSLPDVPAVHLHAAFTYASFYDITLSLPAPSKEPYHLPFTWHSGTSLSDVFWCTACHVFSSVLLVSACILLLLQTADKVWHPPSTTTSISTLSLLADSVSVVNCKPQGTEVTSHTLTNPAGPSQPCMYCFHQYWLLLTSMALIQPLSLSTLSPLSHILLGLPYFEWVLFCLFFTIS